MANTSAQDAWNLVHQGKIGEMKARMVSKWFSWKEVFNNCTVAEIQKAPFSVYTNAAFHSLTMDKIRETFNKPVNVHDWYRGDIIRDRNGKTHDEAAGGTGYGEHPKGLATDFDITGLTPLFIHTTLDVASFMQHCGLENPVYAGIHVDSRGSRARFGPN